MQHANSAGTTEVMGLCVGIADISKREFLLENVFELPIKGTETRVEAAQEASEYMVLCAQHLINVILLRPISLTLKD